MILKRDTVVKPLFLAYSVCHCELILWLEPYQIGGRKTDRQYLSVSSTRGNTAL